MRLLAPVCLRSSRGVRRARVLQRGLLRLGICLHLRYKMTPSSEFVSWMFSQDVYLLSKPTVFIYLLFIINIRWIVHVNSRFFFFVFFLDRLCIGHSIACSVLPVPHVRCQTAHSHDAELPGNPGNLLLAFSKKKDDFSFVSWFLFLFISIHTRQHK